MTYRLGVDLGTTWTAAATWRDDRATIVSLGQRRAAIPSVALLRDDGEFLVGDAAARRAVAEPERVAREFKRRIGDSTPLIVGGRPHTAESLTARLLRFVIDQVSALEGGPPNELAIAHPANWGDFKIDLMRQIIAEAGQDPARCLLITEPEAAAITYATEQRVQPGHRVCVYDLGGGTFDTTVVERTTSGFRILGRPQGIERLGGVDFDAAVFAHVIDRLGDAMQELDPNDPTTLSALARLRLDCTEAKEALSADVTTNIPVFLPTVQTEIRMTRSEFEGLIRPVLHDTIETTRQAIASAGLEPSDIERVLLVGGSSRIPLVSQLVQNELDVHTSIDSHPKHAIALGTAIHLLASDPGHGAGVTIVTAKPAQPTPPAAPPSPAGADFYDLPGLDPDDLDRPERSATGPGAPPARGAANASAGSQPVPGAPPPTPTPAPANNPQRLAPAPPPAAAQHRAPAPPAAAGPVSLAPPPMAPRPAPTAPPGAATPSHGAPLAASPGTPSARMVPQQAQPANPPPGVVPPPGFSSKSEHRPPTPPAAGGAPLPGTAARPPDPPAAIVLRPPQPSPPATAILPGSGLGPGNTEKQPSPNFSQAPSRRRSRSRSTLILLLLFIALMIGFGVFFLLQPPSELFSLNVPDRLPPGLTL